MTPDDIIRELAAIDLTHINAMEPARYTVTTPDGRSIPPHADTWDTMRRLILAARTAEKPIMRPAKQAERADDYLAVWQLSLAIGYDGRLHTAHRADIPKEAIVPALAAVRHLCREIERKQRSTLNLTAVELDRFCDPIIEGMQKQDFEAIRLEIDRSRTDEEPKIVIPGP